MSQETKEEVLSQLINQVYEMQRNLNLAYAKVDDANVQWFLLNATDYNSGLLSELQAAYTYVAGRKE